MTLFPSKVTILRSSGLGHNSTHSKEVLIPLGLKFIIGTCDASRGSMSGRESFQRKEEPRSGGIVCPWYHLSTWIQLCLKLHEAVTPSFFKV